MENLTSSFKCDLCHKMFLRKSTRNRHVREQHLQPNKYDCKQCSSRFSKKYNLQMHVKHVHSNLKQIKCSHCTMGFAKLANLKEHVEMNHKSCTAIDCSNNAVLLHYEGDAQALAESVLKELKQLQKDIQPPVGGVTVNHSKVQETNYVENKEVKVISIKDNLYPLGHFTLVKTQTIRNVDGLIYLKCEFCGKEFRKNYSFLRHLRIHTKVRPYLCVLCKKAFPTTAQLKSHCHVHKLDDKIGLFHKLYRCPKCNEGFSAINQLDKHLSSISSCNVTFKCPKCLKSFKTLQTLLRHKHSKEDNELEMLKIILPSPLFIGEKLKTSKANKNNFECNFCGIQTNKKILLKQHVKRHENLFKNQCGNCQSSFATQSSLNIHNKVHVISRQYKCHYCQKCFNTSQSCRRHMLTHLKELLEMHKENNKLLSFPTILENEEMAQNLETKTIILKPGRNYKTIRREVSSGHNSLKYKCSKCEKSFRYKAWLKKHFKYKHSDEVLHECKTCFKKFRTKQSLQTHLLLHSAKRSKVTCQVCGRLYASSKSLKVHLRIHMQEKPFNCNKCCERFRTSGHLIYHCKRNHKE